MDLSDIRIGWRLGAAFGAILALFILVAVPGMRNAARNDAAGQTLFEAVEAKRKTFIDRRNGIIELLKQARCGEGRVPFEESLQPAVNEYKAALGAFTGFQQKTVEAKIAEISGRHRENRVVAMASPALRQAA